MEEFPANSRKAKEPGKDAPEKRPERFEKVVENTVMRRKKSRWTKFKDIFAGEDSASVAETVFLDILIPGVKDMIVDAGVSALERKFYGSARTGARRARGRTHESPFTPYNRYSSSSPFRDREPERPSMSRRARASHDFDELVFRTRVEAEEIIDRLFDAILRYEAVSVRDLYDMTGAEATPQDLKWGWTDIRGAGVQRTRAGYILNLPRPEPLD